MVHSELRLATAALFCATPHGAVLPNTVSRAATRPLADLSWSPSLGVNVEGVPLQQTWAFQCGDPCKPAAGDPAPPRGHAISYITAGAEKDPPLLLIHGFGASSFHWRSNVNALAQAGNRVYAIDLLGFGSSDKPLLDYDLDVWVAQCASFLREVVGCGEPIKGDNSTLAKRAVVAGNSIGGLTALALAAAEPSLVRGVATLNCAGRFSPTPAERVQAQRRKRVRDTTSPMKGFATAWSGTVDSVGAALRRVLLGGAFVVTKQPARISQARLALQIRMRDRQCLGLGREARGEMLAGRVNSQPAVVWSSRTSRTHVPPQDNVQPGAPTPPRPCRGLVRAGATSGLPDQAGASRCGSRLVDPVASQTSECGRGG